MLYWDRFTKASLRLERYFPYLDQVEAIRQLALAEELSGLC